MGLNYNILFRNSIGPNNFLLLDDKEFGNFLDAYRTGNRKFFLRGKIFDMHDIHEVNIFLNERGKFKDYNEFLENGKKNGFGVKNIAGDFYFTKSSLVQYGKEVTDKYIEGPPGYFNELKSQKKLNLDYYVDPSRIKEIKEIQDPQFDYTRLIQNLNELNLAYNNEMYLSVTYNIRAVLDQIPPIFNQIDFKGVIGQHGSQSFKANMDFLEKSSRKIADANLHTHIRKKESLPKRTQVDFRGSFDVLLGEIVRYRLEQLN